MKFKLLFVLFLLSSYCFADTLSDLPIQTIAGNQYYVYVVGKKETIYGICKKLNISKRNYTARKADLARYCLGMGMARYEGSEILQKSSVYLSLQKTTNSKSIVCLA